MAQALARRRRHYEAPYWPGFVDAMAQLLLVITFLLSVFIVAQFLLAREISGQDSALGQLRSQIAELTELLALEKSAKAELELNLSTLGDDLQAEKARSASLSVALEGESEKGSSAGTTISGLRTALDEEKQISSDALAKVELLNQQLAALRRQIATLNGLLSDAETRSRTDQAQIIDLGKRLNSALAQRVQELTRYRSEFFGRLRKILSQRSDILVVGDRFVFQSEVFFDAGQAILKPEGMAELDTVANALAELERQIPGDIAWVMRVDGHTDVRPIVTAQYPSNWALSSARAISVVQYLIAKGVSPQRLVAAGFGEFQPLDNERTDEAYRRNRRIELKLTER
jgi:chemotaxis protein MotB